MKNRIQVVGPILFLAYLLVSRYVPMHDFVAGMLLGLSAVSSAYTVYLFGKSRAKKLV
ncbi:hypothetical protein FHS18_005332 [Paenibacillus phyllosphaerae]|uniref:Uncharacterized protein n=1 Tax=Paenibacillus phyllosphaerae TaxID=274593 RepID=A0A7W5B302_9BACL|nr:hypothetical protein [Paenibacillus phyllosphaerae]MBB3113229.1 hypothetical protein [Paenibacillus phyllosphaerae]